jgi:hypothetical protein
MRSAGIIRGLVISAFFCSCIQEQKSGITSPLYFDVSGLINKQVKILQSNKFKLKKDLRVESSVESKVVDNVIWDQELEAFKSIDINIPVLRETFKIDTINRKKGKKIVYQAKESIDKGVSKLALTFDLEGNLEEIEGILMTDNILYSSEKKFDLDFTQDQNKPILKSYKIDTRERLLFRRSCGNTVKGQIISSL